MLKEIVLPPIDMKNFSSQPIDTNLIIMSHDFNVNELVIPFYETNVFDTYEAFYSFQGNTSIIIQEVFNQHNEIRIPIVNEVRRHKGIFTIELNASSNSSQATLLKLNVMVKRSNIDSNSEFLFNHYYKLFEDYEKEIAELNNATQSTIKKQLKQSQDNLQKVSQTLLAINDKVMVVNDTADGFMLDVATKQADVTSKYNAFDTSVTQANQTIDELLALQPQFQAVLDETTGKDVISAPEIILARGGEADLKTRLDKEHQEVTAQLAQTSTIIKPTMSTVEIQTLLNKGGDFKFKTGTYNLTFTSVSTVPTCLDIQSNSRIEFEKGVLLKSPSSDQGRYTIVNITGKQNVEINGGTIQGDRFTHTDSTSRIWKMWTENTSYQAGDIVYAYHIGYKCIVAGTSGMIRPTHTSGTSADGTVTWEIHTTNLGEWGHGILISTSSNVEINGTVTKECWGDGLTIQSNSTNITIDGVTSDNNRRQGVSIGSVENLFIKKSKFSNTKGTLPEAGIDIEPASGRLDRLKNIFIDDCISENNAGSGFELNLMHIVKHVEPADEVRIFLDKFVSKNNLRGFAYVCSHTTEPLRPVHGLVRFTNSSIKDCYQGVGLYNILDKTMPKLEVDNLTIESWGKNAIHTTHTLANESPSAENIIEYGGYHFKGLTLVNPPTSINSGNTSDYAIHLYSNSVYKKINAIFDDLLVDASVQGKSLFWENGDGHVKFVNSELKTFNSSDSSAYSKSNGQTTFTVDSTFELPLANMNKGREFTLVQNGGSNAFRVSVKSGNKINGLNNLVAGVANMIAEKGTVVTFKSNGVDAWDVVTLIGSVSPVGFINKRKVLYASTPPAVGTFSSGDIVYNHSPVAGGHVGWVCVGGGTPGTWKTFGKITT